MRAIPALARDERELRAWAAISGSGLARVARAFLDSPRHTIRVHGWVYPLADVRRAASARPASCSSV